MPDDSNGRRSIHEAVKFETHQGNRMPNLSQIGFSLIDDVLQRIFASDVLSPRDRVNISCTSKQFKHLALKALLSKIVWSNVQTVLRTLIAWNTFYAPYMNLVQSLIIDIPAVDAVMEDADILESVGMEPHAVESFITGLSKLRHIEVISDTRFFWSASRWPRILARVSSLTTFSLAITVAPDHYHHSPRAGSEKFDSWKQLKNMSISIHGKELLDQNTACLHMAIGLQKLLTQTALVYRIANPSSYNYTGKRE
ncbi:hypothetical protein BDQ17DRAFT_946753 [Cyathus striatus]|nr:hypothetical protein BDQ17DRAFT_946753 [Cyathus striatus]